MVYVGVVNTKHLEVASLMLRGGKHVLCEKPLCMNLRQTWELLEVARQNERFLMEVRGAAVTAGHTCTTSNSHLNYRFLAKIIAPTNKTVFNQSNC